MSDTEEGTISPYAFFAFYSLYKHFHPYTKKLIDFDSTLNHTSKKLFPDEDVDYNEKHSLFITWKKQSKQLGNYDDEEEDGYQLRGCIGTFSASPLYYGLEKYSLIAALEDTRFSPISKKELPLLSCGCNILSDSSPIYTATTGGDIFDWEIGKHGVEVRFRYPKRNGKLLSATFLPDVMVEQKWDKLDTFMNLIQKAGVYDSMEEILENYEKYFIQVTRYEGHKSVITYDQFKSKFKEIDDISE